MQIASTTQPLSDVLPWGNPITVSSSSSDKSHDLVNDTYRKNVVDVDDRTLLITDATSTDGRFVLHTLALQFLSNRYSLLEEPLLSMNSSDDCDNSSPATNNTVMEGAVLWISCTSVAEKQIMQGLRKGLQHNLGGGNTTGPASNWMGGKSGNSIGSSNDKMSSTSSSASSGQSGDGSGSSSGRINIVSIPLELADAALLDDSNDDNSFSHEEYLKQLHKRVVHWLKRRELQSMVQQQQKQQSKDVTSSSSLGPNLIIIDNATTLGTMFGNRLANAFISSVQSSMKKHSKICCSSPAAKTPTSHNNNNITTTTTTVTTINLLAIRASSPDDGGLYNFDTDEGTLKGEKLRSEYARLLRPWLGLGSGMPSNSTNGDGAGTNIIQLEEQTNYLTLCPDSISSIVYTSGLYEISDGIVDVSPLESGYARDVLGRISFVPTWSGKGWWGVSSAAVNSGSGNVTKKDDISSAYASICVNYRCDDSGARIMRLRSR